jgi:hypothetical protein
MIFAELFKQPLTEVSDATKQSYRAQAQAQVRELEPHARKGEYRDIAQRAITRRQKGLARLNKKDVDEGLTGAALGGAAGAFLTKSPTGAITGANIGSDIQDALSEFAPVGGDDDGGDDEEEILFKYAKMWYNAPYETQDQIERILEKMGWEIGEIESEEGGAFVVQSGDEHGRSYIGFEAADLTEGVAEGSTEANVPDPVIMVYDKNYKILDKLNASVAAQKYRLGNVNNIKQQLAHQEYTPIGNYIIGAPMGGQPIGETETMNEYNAEYDDEAGMVDNNLETLKRAVGGLDELIQSGDNLPEWCQEKIAVAKSMLVSVWDYMYSEEASDEVDPEIDEMFEAMDQLVGEMAVKNGVNKDLVWEQFEAMPDRVLYETAAWRRKEGKSAKGGLNAKGVASYRRENPGSKLQMAVTTKPSKLKPGSKAAKRRKSFCARMSGVKGPMKKPNGKPTRKALALRKWNC